MDKIIQLLQDNVMARLSARAILSAIPSTITFLIQSYVESKTEKKRINKKNKWTLVIIIFTFSFLATFIPDIFDLSFENSTTVEESVEIPADVTQSPFKLILLDCLGEFYYEDSGKKEFLSQKLGQTDVNVDLYSEDYHRHYTDYTIKTNNWGEIAYCFGEIPAGNYTITVSAEGYQTRRESLSFDTSGRSTSINEEPFWQIRLNMERLDSPLTSFMAIRFFDINNEPLVGLEYRIDNYEIRKDDVLTETRKTDNEGGCEEIISVKPESEFWITFINP